MEARKIKQELVVAAIFVAFCLLLLFYIIPTGIPLKASWGGDVGVNSRTFPYFSTFLMGVCSLLMLVKKAFALSKLQRAQRNSAQSNESPKIAMAGEIRAIVVFLFFILYGVLFVTIGFIASTLIICPITLFYLGERSWKRLPLYLYVYLFAAIMYVVFTVFLMVQFP